MYRNIENDKTKKRNIIVRPEEEWKILDNVAPAIVTKEVWDQVQLQLAFNKEDSLKNNNPDTPKEELGAMRSGYCKCGICGHTMVVVRRGMNGPQYYCKQRLGSDLPHNHITAMSVRLVDAAALEKVREVVRDPRIVRLMVAKQREAPKPTVDPEDIATTLSNIQTEIDNLMDFARHASNDSTRNRLGLELEALEKRQRDTEALLHTLDEDEEAIAKLEEEINKFEAWASDVAEDFEKPVSYEELRYAVHILGLHAVVYPAHGDYPFRCMIEAFPPKIMKELGSCVPIELGIKTQNPLLSWVI